MDINTPLEILNYKIKNRVVIPPMASQLATLNGEVTDKHIEHYKSLASTGAGLVNVEYSYINLEGKSEPNQLSAAEETQLDGLKKIAKTIKDQGPLAGFQLAHAGGKSSSKYAQDLISPSGIKVPVKGVELPKPKEASFADIDKLKKDFIKAASLGYKAGFDLVEIHSAHGYGLNQWISPLTNKRDDEFGGSVLGRSKILLDIVSEIKKTFPDKLLSVRLAGQDHFPEGLTPENSLLIAIELEKLGLNVLSISSGIGGWRRPDNREGEGYLVDDAIIFTNNLSIPVIGVGGIKTRDYIEHSLSENKFDLAAIGRGFLEDRELGKELGLL